MGEAYNPGGGVREREREREGRREREAKNCLSHEALKRLIKRASKWRLPKITSIIRTLD